MFLKPIYAENIIVGCIYKEKFSWYITEKELWFLDYEKMEEAYKKRGYFVCEDEECEERKDLKIVSEKNAEKFLERINLYKVSENQLTNLAKANRGKIEILNICPAILVDFDKKKLYSLFPEPAGYENYVPNGWKGIYTDFTDLIPENEKYWMDNDVNMLKLNPGVYKDGR